MALQAFAKKHESLVRGQKLFDGRGCVVIRLRRFTAPIDLDKLSDTACEYIYEFKSNVLFNIKGAESLAR